MDSPESIVDGAIAHHVRMIKEFGGVPGVRPERLAEGYQASKPPESPLGLCHSAHSVTVRTTGGRRAARRLWVPLLFCVFFVSCFFGVFLLLRPAGFLLMAGLRSAWPRFRV
jgi:hypothetical protein